MAGNKNSGRNALPASLHLINGNPSKKSAANLAAAAGEGQKTKVVRLPPPVCPDFLTAAAKIEWKRIVDDLMVMGVLSRIDRAQLAVYCQAWADWKMAREMLKAIPKGGGFIDTTPSGYKQMSAMHQVANRAEERMLKAGALFGLNPAARASMQIQAPQAELFPHEEKEAADRFFGSN